MQTDIGRKCDPIAAWSVSPDTHADGHRPRMRPNRAEQPLARRWVQVQVPLTFERQ